MEAAGPNGRGAERLTRGSVGRTKGSAHRGGDAPLGLASSRRRPGRSVVLARGACRAGTSRTDGPRSGNGAVVPRFDGSRATRTVRAGHRPIQPGVRRRSLAACSARLCAERLQCGHRQQLRHWPHADQPRHAREQHPQTACIGSACGPIGDGPAKSWT